MCTAQQSALQNMQTCKVPVFVLALVPVLVPVLVPDSVPVLVPVLVPVMVPFQTQQNHAQLPVLCSRLP